jgi:hypothetical protein
MSGGVCDVVLDPCADSSVNEICLRPVVKLMVDRATADRASIRCS